MNIIYLYKLQSCIQATLDGQQAFGQTVNSIPIYAKSQCSCLLYFLFEKTCVVNCFIRKKKKTRQRYQLVPGSYIYIKVGFLWQDYLDFSSFFLFIEVKKKSWLYYNSGSEMKMAVLSSHCGNSGQRWTFYFPEILLVGI